MNNIPKECIIIGGGTSINDGLSLGLKDKIEDKFVITTNFSCYHFNSTFTTYIDKDFYEGVLNPHISHEINQEHVNKLKSLPLIIGNKFAIDYKYYDNTIPVQCCNNYYSKDFLKKGFYTGNLTGIFSISLTGFLMNFEGIIYLLGFDWNKRPIESVDRNNYNPNSNLDTHYYKKEIQHKGIGYVGYYENHNPNNYFKYFLEEKNLKIYNVSLNSNIECFEKVSYEEIFKLLNKEVYNQEEIRKEILKIK